jgi:hypothetical protein
LVKHFSFGKTYIFSWLNFFLVKTISILGLNLLFWQNFFFFLVTIFSVGKILYIFLAKILSFRKTYIPSWLNLYLLAKTISFSTKLLSLGKTYISSWLNLFFLAKPISLLG